VRELQPVDLGPRLGRFPNDTRDTRQNGLATRYPRGKRAELKRRDDQITLTNTRVEGFAFQPRRAVVLFFPGAARDDPRLLAGQFDAGLLAKSQMVRGCLDPVDPQPARHFVEEHVARHDDPAVQIDMAMSMLLPAMELMIAKPDGAAA